mmetsp:Transcript_12304/g.44866  ORF Transcript_12304/g.44866 Transcript_12304/m.44866 type:complete len:489 (+) Transcript_12304:223-1689(+)
MQAACERGATLALHGTCSGSGLRGKLRRRASQNLSRPVCNRVVTKYVACTVSCRQSDSSALRSSWPLHRTRILLASVENVPTSAGSISRKQVACFGLPFSRELTPEEIERGKADLKQGLEEAEEEQKASVKKTKKTKKKKSRSQQDQRVLDAKEQLKTGGAVAFSVEDERGTGVEVISDEFSAESLASTPSFELLVDGSDDGEDGASLDVLQQDEAFYSDLSDEQIAALPDDLLFGTDPTDLQGKAAPRKQADAYVQYYEKYKHLAEEYGDKRLLRRKERGLGSFEAAASSRRARMEIKSERQEYQEELMAQFGANMSANVRKTHKNMRIIAGEAAGFRLLTPRGQNVRPMMEKVRAAVFSSLEAQVHHLTPFLPSAILRTTLINANCLQCEHDAMLRADGHSWPPSWGSLARPVLRNWRRGHRGCQQRRGGRTLCRIRPVGSWECLAPQPGRRGLRLPVLYAHPARGRLFGPLQALQQYSRRRVRLH